MGDFFGGLGSLVMAVPIILFVLWAVVCVWAVGKLLRLDAALITKVLWGVAILAFPVAGLIAFLLLADRTPQLERELGIHRY